MSLYIYALVIEYKKDYYKKEILSLFFIVVMKLIL